MILTAGLLILRPVPIVKEENALKVKGIVKGIHEGGENDVVFYLENHDTRYYINRGLENGLNLASLKNKLMGKEVTIKYPKYWTPLDWDNEIRHLSKLEYKGEVLFNELK
jgi:hypothetical protein